MKMYIDYASTRPVSEELKPVPGFTFEPAHYQFQARPAGGDLKSYTQHAWTVEINSLEDMLRLVETTGKQGNAIMLEWQPEFPPAPPRQNIPNITIVDDYL